jgi:hypothetical protein
MPLDKQTGVKDIESTLKQAQKSGENMDAVIRQEYLAITPADRQAALAQIKKDKVSDPTLPGLEITDSNGSVSVKSDTTQSWSSWGKDQVSNVEAGGRGVIASAEKDLNDFYHAIVDPFNNERKLIPGQQ